MTIAYLIVPLRDDEVSLYVTFHNQKIEMGNFTSCKIYVKKLEGELQLADLKFKIEVLQDRNNINQNISVYHSKRLNAIEIRFGAKWYPTMISEIFPRSEFEIWNITSDEGGWKDQIRHYIPNSNNEEYCENALYKFNQVRIKGDTGKINSNLDKIFGSAIQMAETRLHKDYVEIIIDCLYTSNNYFRDEYDRKLLFELSHEIPVTGKFGQETELWDLKWSIENMEFRERFYQEVLNRPNGTTEFPFVNSLEFLLNNKVTNIIRWNSKLTWSNWEHIAMNDYTNIVNPNYLKTNE